MPRHARGWMGLVFLATTLSSPGCEEEAQTPSGLARLALPDAGQAPGRLPERRHAEPLSVSMGGDVAVCPGEPALLWASASGAVPPYAYRWSGEACGPECQGVPAIIVSPDATATYALVVRDAASSQASGEVTVTVLEGATALAGPEQTTRAGLGVTLGAPAVDGHTYLWSCNRPDCALSQVSAAQPLASPNASTTYWIEATSSEGCIATTAVTVWVELRVAGTWPADGDPAYPLAAPLFVELGEDVLPESLNAGTVQLTSGESGALITTELSYDAAARRLTIVPADPAYGSGVYVLTLLGGADGVLSSDPILPSRLASDFSIGFSTAPADTPLLLFADDFEAGTTRWALDAGFGTTTRSYHSSRHSLSDSPEDTYGPDVDVSAALATPLDVAGVSSVRLSFWMRAATERADPVLVEIRLDGGEWIEIDSFAGRGAWRQRSLAIDTSGHAALELRFRLLSNGNKQRDGFYLDDVVIEAE